MPLAIPLMDLRLEKVDLPAGASISAREAEPWHFKAPLDEPTLAALCDAKSAALPWKNNGFEVSLPQPRSLTFAQIC
jgi:hypothetical protein